MSTGARAVLVVDDDARVRLGVRLALRTRGYTSVLTCDDPRQVEEMVRANDVAVVLLDLIMPQRSGEAVLTALQADWPTLPVIVVSAEGDAETRRQCLGLGAADFLCKPVSPTALVAAIERAAARAE